MSVVASASNLGSKRPAPSAPTVDDLETVTELEVLFDLLGLPNGAGKQANGHSAISGEPVSKRPKRTPSKTEPPSERKTASSVKTSDLVGLYSWAFLEAFKDANKNGPSPQASAVPSSPTPTVNPISGSVKAMIKRYNHFFKRGTRAISNKPPERMDVMLRLPKDWTSPRATGPLLQTENVHLWLIELQLRVENAIKENSMLQEHDCAATNSTPGNAADDRESSETPSQASYTRLDYTEDFLWSIWHHCKYTMFTDHDNLHNELVEKLQSKDLSRRVQFVERTMLKNESPRREANQRGSVGFTGPFLFGPLLTEVPYDASERLPAPAGTDVVEKWSPIWIELQLDKLFPSPNGNLSPEALYQLQYYLAHLKDINQLHIAQNTNKSSCMPAWKKVDGIKLDSEYLKGREDYYYWRRRYMFSTQETILALVHKGYRFCIGPIFTGELNVERSFDPFIALIRQDDITELKSGCELVFPKAMQPFSTIPKPDVSCRLIAVLWSDKPNLAHTAPSVFIGEAKFNMGDDDHVLAQIAISMHPNLLIMALYYLDHCKDVTDPIPPWLFLFGIRYFANGFGIYAYYFDWSIVEKKFKFYSVPLAGRTYEALEERPSEVMKMKVVSVLGCLQSQNYFVGEQLSNWKGRLKDKYLELSS